eukprot:SAG22_NODE_449_length_10399_cov_43.159515_8_plen_1444_part_01
MEAMIRPVARTHHKSFAEAKIRLEATGPPTYFVSHAWDSLFVDLVESVAAFLEGAAQDETYAWLDIFAINQDDTGGTFSAMAELDDGRTLARVIELSRATLVVLDKERVAPFTRLWCLYEIGSTPTSKLQLLTHGFSEKDISQHVWNIDAETALCFSPDDKKMIREEITGRFGYGTLQRFTTELRLRLLLRPMSYAADLKALCDRAGPQETYNFDTVWQHVQAAAGRVVCVVGGAGEGKSTLAAMMLSYGDEDEGAIVIHAAHFCKRADTNRQDLGGIARSIGYQLAQHVDHSDGMLFGLTREEAETMQTDPDAAVKLLIIRQLEGLAAAGRRVVLLVDALDEAQDRGTNRVVRLLQGFGKAKTNALSVVVTMRPDPEANLIVLRSAFGLENVLELPPSTLRVVSAVGEIGQSEDVLRSAPQWAAAMVEKEQSKIYVTVCRGFVEKWLASSRPAAKLPTPPANIDEAYKLWFELQPQADGVKQLLGVVMAAREPLSSAHLDELGLLAARDSLPGWGLLFEDREHLLQTLHLSVREFLLDATRSGLHAADVASGHVMMARSCLNILQERAIGPTLEYALRHGHVHLAEVLKKVTTKGTAVVHEWFQAFLEPRYAGAEAVAATCREPEVERVEVDPRSEAHVQQKVAVPKQLWENGKECYICRRKFSLPRRRYHCRVCCGRSCCDDHSAGSVVLHGTENESSEQRVCDICVNQPRRHQHSPTTDLQLLQLSPWKARELTAVWLERQAEHGRSKQLVPELTMLEEALKTRVGESATSNNWLHMLWQLVQHLRWGVGTFWAPHYDTTADTARSMFAANIVATGPFYRSAVSAKLSQHRLCLPMRIAVSPTIQQLIGHSSEVMSAQFSPDGQKIVSASGDKTVRVWSAVTGECEQTLEGHSCGVTSAQFSPDGEKIVSASWDKTVRVWSAVTGECAQTLQGHINWVRSAQFSPGGQKIVSAGHDKTVRVWSAVTGECEQTLEGHSSGVTSAQFSADGEKIVSASNDKMVRVWSAVTGECEQTLEGHSNTVTSAQFSPDGEKIVSASSGGTVRVWSVVTGECEQTLEGHTSDVNSASFSPGGQKIVSASDDKTVRVWSAVTGECEQTLEGHTGTVMSASLGPDGQKIVSTSFDNTVRVWSAVTGECEQTMKGHTDTVMSAQFGPDRQQIVSASDDKTVRVWSAVTGECEQTLEGHTKFVNSAQFSADGEKIVSASYDKTVRVWSVVTGECAQTLQGHADTVYSAQFSPDGEKIVSASGDKTVRVWSAVTGECEQTLEGHTNWVMLAQFSPDGEKIVSASTDKMVRVWSAVTGECEQTLEGHTNWVRSAQFSPGGQKIVSASDDKTVRVWSAVTGECEQTLEGHNGDVMSAQFSADGEKIVSASYDKTVRVWSVGTGECEQTLQGHNEVVMSAQFSTDGEKIVSASRDKTVRVWSVVTGECEQRADSGGP